MAMAQRRWDDLFDGFGQLRDDTAERGADYDTDCQIDNISARDELLEFFSQAHGGMIPLTLKTGAFPAMMVWQSQAGVNLEPAPWCAI